MASRPLERALYARGQVPAIILARRNIRDIAVAAVDECLPSTSFGLVPVIRAIELAVEVILVAAPGEPVMRSTM